MDRRLLACAGILATAVVAAGCTPASVRLAYAPEVGDVRTYRYELTATITQMLEGEAPVRSEVDAVLDVEETTLEVHAGGALARLSVRRDGGPAREVEVRLDRSGSLAGIDLVEGEPEPAVDLGLLQGVLATLPLPDGPLEPGDEWMVEEGALTGHGRLRRLAVVDGEDTAVVRSSAEQQIDEQIPTSGTVAAVTGTIRSTATTTYDLDGGAIRRSTVRADGAVDLQVSPPPGVDVEPVLGQITYEVRVTVTRVD